MGSGRIEPFALHGFPDEVTAQALPKALKAPDHVQLPIRKMLEEAVGDEPYHVLPVVVPLVGDFFLQDGTDGDHRRKRVAENKELQS
jgi:hypothetical protein